MDEDREVVRISLAALLMTMAFAVWNVWAMTHGG